MTIKSDGKLCFAYIPARYVFIFMSSLGLLLIYAYKGFLGVAIVAMVRQDDNSLPFGDECPIDENMNETDIQTRAEFDWGPKQQAVLLGSFFYGYIVTQIPAGIMTEVIGAKWMFGSSILISSLLSVVGPVAARWGFVPFLLTRIGQGLAGGILLPSMNALIARWMTRNERSRALSFIMTGAAFGSVITMPLTGYLCDETFLGGWPAIFYVLGIVGCVWFVFWCLLVFDSPETHPYITQKELEYIDEGQGIEKTSSKSKIPWKSIVTSYPVYACIIAGFGFNWGYLTILTLLPTYFDKVLHMNIKTNGLISSLPYIAQAFVSCISSYITDKMRGKSISITVLRKVNNSIAFFGTGICLIAVVLSKCDSTLSIVFFVIGMGLNGCSYSGFMATYLDMAPDYAGVIMGFVNTFANTPGFIAPVVAASFYSDGQTLRNWSLVFYTCSAVYFFTQIIYIFFSSSELQTWGLSRKDEKKVNETNS